MRGASGAPVVDLAVVPENNEEIALQDAFKLVRMRARTVAAAVAVPSPCISICRMNESSGWCEGCFRTRGEIAGWSSADDAGKRGIWKMIEQRMDALQS